MIMLVIITTVCLHSMHRIDMTCLYMCHTFFDLELIVCRFSE